MQLLLLLFRMRNGQRTAQKGCFCVRNGSVTPREEGFTKQTQVMLLGGWCAEAYRGQDPEIGVKLEPWLRRYSEKKVHYGVSVLAQISCVSRGRTLLDNNR